MIGKRLSKSNGWFLDYFTEQTIYRNNSWLYSQFAAQTVKRLVNRLANCMNNQETICITEKTDVSAVVRISAKSEAQPATQIVRELINQIYK